MATLLATAVGACRGDGRRSADHDPQSVAAAAAAGAANPNATGAQIAAAVQAQAGSPVQAAVAQSFKAAAAGALQPQFAAAAVAAETKPATVTLPQVASGAMHVQAGATAAAVDVTLPAAQAVAAQTVGGYVVYPGALGTGATVLHRPLPAGSEDFVYMTSRPATPEVDYKISLGSGVAGLRLVGGVLEFLDSTGTPQLHVSPPFIVGADGTPTDGALAVSGCSVDSDPSPPWGRAVTAPGATTCTVKVTWPDAAVTYPAILDPRWTTTGSMATARFEHTLILLSTGKALAAGGRSSTTGTTGLASAELYDRTSGTWSATGSMAHGRRLHTAIQLGTSSNPTTSGKTLVAGGISGTTSMNSAELYSPSAGTWTAAGTMDVLRHGHTATLLADGRVLAAGGLNGTTTLASASLYNPASGAGSWVATTGPIPPPGLKNHTATLIQTTNHQLNNYVLLVGGNNGTSTLSAVLLFDPVQNSFSTLASISTPREQHTAMTLQNTNGKILVAGGKNGSTVLSSAIVFDPSVSNGTWSSAGTMTSPRVGHTMTLLPNTIVANGQVLVAGGSSNGTNVLSSAELFSGTSTWTATPSMPGALEGHQAVLLTGNMILAAGGLSSSSTVQNAAYLYDASFGLACGSNGQCASGFCANGVCCDTACNGGTCGACNLAGHLGTCTLLSSGSVCRGQAGPCDVAETCNGTSFACPADGFQASGTVCRAAAGECDVAETCSGTAAACPSDAKKASGTSCTDDGNVCTVDRCDGTNVACQHPAGNPGAVCRASAGDCDVAETCTGSSSTCPGNGFKPASTVCRVQSGVCDVAESCTGGSASCPADSKVANGTSCNDGNACVTGKVCQAGACSNGQTVACTGSGSTTTTSIGQSGGSVSLESVYVTFPNGVFTNATGITITSTTSTAPSGVAAYSPIYKFQPDGAHFTLPATVTFVVGTGLTNPTIMWSRPGGGWDDLGGTYANGAISAPISHFSEGFVAVSQCAGQPDNTACTDGDLCTTETCQGGLCTHGPDLTCPVLDQCHADVCDPAVGCTSVPAANGKSCDDGNPATQGETCQAGSCAPVPIQNLPIDDLGTLGGSAFAQAVNSSGQVVGRSGTPAGFYQAFLWTAGGAMVDIGADPGFPSTSSATAISDSGFIAGSINPSGLSSHVFSFSPQQQVTDLGYGAEVGGDNQPFVDPYSGFTYQGAYGYGVNDSGQIAATMTSGGQFRGIVYTPGHGVVDMGSLAGSTWATAIANDGTVVGSSQVPDTLPFDYSYFGHAVMYRDNLVLIDMNDYVEAPGSPTLVRANAISDKYIAGTAQAFGPVVPFRFNRATEAVEFLPTTWAGDTFTSGVNNVGEVVGFGTIDAQKTQQAAFIYSDQLGFRNLNDLLPANSGWNLQVAAGINDSGDVVGWGLYGGSPRAFRLRVSPETVACQGQNPGPVCLWVDGVVESNGKTVALFGYRNSGSANVQPTTNQEKLNGLVVPNPSPAPPQSLLTGEHPGAFLPAVSAGDTVAWTVDGQTASVTAYFARQLGTSPLGSTGSSVEIGDTQVVVQPDAASSVTPVLVGIAVEGGTTKAIFTYTTSAPAGVRIPYGPQNGLFDSTNSLIAAPPQTPPTYFQPGTHAPFVVAMSGNQVTWTVQGVSVTASASGGAQPLQVVATGDGTNAAVLPPSIGGGRINLDSTPPADPVVGPLERAPAGKKYNGALAGQFAVTPSGAATYTVPITIPPGIGGMAPNLSLVYNSQAGDGIAGQGWSLSGLSMITRCPRTRQQDGYGRPVMMDSLTPAKSGAPTDGICLDGNKLFEQPAGSGNYVPERQDFSTITRVATGEFQVVTKAGQTRYYGLNQSSSRISGLNGETAAWLLDRVVDGWGNYFDIHYNHGLGNDGLNAETFAASGILVSSIDYTGSLAPNANTRPFNTISFQYKPRADVRWTRYGNVKVPQSGLLQSITTPAGTYALTYQGNELQAINYCTGSDCMQPLTFTWPSENEKKWAAASSYALPSTVVTKGKGQGLKGTQFLDINGDGLTDFIVARTNGVDGHQKPQIATLMNTGSGWSAPLDGFGQTFPAYLSDENDAPTDVRFADVDGDGRPDVIIAEANVYDSGKGYVSCPVNLSCPGQATHYEPAIWLNRFTTDGGGGWEFHKEYGTLPNDSNNLLTDPNHGIVFSGSNPVTVADVNGDGRADLVLVGQTILSVTNIDILLAQPVGAATKWVSQKLHNLLTPNPGRLQLVDVNRDGLPDLDDQSYTVVDGTAYSTETTFINTTNGLGDGTVAFNLTPVTHSPPVSGGIGIGGLYTPASVGDVDGDGFYDLVAYYNAAQLYGNTNPAAVVAAAGFGDGTGFGLDVFAQSYVNVLKAFSPPSVVLDTSLIRLPDGGLLWGNAFPTFVGDPTAVMVSTAIAPLETAFALVDINGDGLADLVLNHQGRSGPVNPTHTAGQIFLNTGTTWAPVSGTTGWTMDAGPDAVPGAVPSAATQDFGSAFVDLNGDGLPDFIQADDDSDYLADLSIDLKHPGQLELVQPSAWINPYQQRRIQTFPNGRGRPTTVQYASTASAGTSVYEDDVVPEEPNTKLLPLPLNVVSTVTGEDGSGTDTTSDTSYKYHSLRQDTFGRGPVGFHRVESYDAASKVRTITTYAQAFPYTGLPTEMRKYQVVEDQNHVKTDHLLSLSGTHYCDTPDPEPNNPYRCLVLPDTSPVGAQQSVFVFPEDVSDLTFLRPEQFTTSDPPDPLPDLPNTLPDNVTVTRHFQYDDEGNAVDILTTTAKKENGATESWSKEIENKYETDAAAAEGKPTLVTETGTGGTKTTKHVSSYEYSSMSGFGGLSSRLAVTKKHIEPLADWPVREDTAYRYDEFGHVVATLTCASDFDSCDFGNSNASEASSDPGHHPPFRLTSVSYDPLVLGTPVTYGIGRFPTKTTNALGQTATTTYDPVLGRVVRQTDLNGIQTCYQYDSFGRLTSETDRCGSAAPVTTTTDYFEAPATICFPTCDPGTVGFSPPHSSVMTVMTMPTGATIWTYADDEGKKTGSLSYAFDGGFIETTTAYNILGQVSQTSRPVHLSSLSDEPTMDYTTMYYDDYHRVKSVIGALGDIDGTGTDRSTEVDSYYNGSQTEVDQSVNGATHVRQEIKNALGKVAQVNTPGQNGLVPLKFLYDADGNLTTTVDPAGNQVGISYDSRGRKSGTVDLDMGTWAFVSDGFGDVVSQTDAKTQVTTMTYDQLGRMVTKTDSSGTAQWIYDSAPGAGKGKLAAMVSAPDGKLNGTCVLPAGVAAGLTGDGRAVKSYAYDEFGQVNQAVECADGSTFAMSYQYDALGREGVVRYPVVNGSQLAVGYHYTTLGDLQYVTNESTDYRVIWQAKAMDVLGHVRDEQTENGVETISNRNTIGGWLLNRTAVAHNDANNVIQNASYSFDEAGNLLTKSRTDAASGAASSEQFWYDLNSRLTNSTTTMGPGGAGSYGYDDLGNLTQKNGSVYSYNSGCLAGGRTAGPHAVCTVGSGSSYAYDGNGNVVGAGGRSLTYNAQNRTVEMDDAGGAVVSFGYGADGNRVLQSVTKGASTSRTVYVGLGPTGKSLYERTTTDGVTKHVHFLYAGGAHDGNAFAVVTLGDAGSSPVSQYYAFDHLGSVVAVSDEQGHVVSAQAGGPNATVLGYDAWGARRNPDGTSADPASFSLVTGHREFTSQEQVPDTGVVNMNGRLYDPVLGRFLSPDPNVQALGDLQSYNRYTYVLNNPLRYNDPTGFFWSGIGSWFEKSFSSPWNIVLTLASPWTITTAAFIASAVVSGATPYTAASVYHAIGLGIGFVGEGVEYVAHEVGKIPVIGGPLEDALALNPWTGIPWALHDFHDWWRPAAQGAVLYGGIALTVLAGGLPGPLMFYADVGIGFGEGFASAKLAGADNTTALGAGIMGAVISGLSAGITLGQENAAARGIYGDAVPDGNPAMSELGDPAASEMEDSGYADTAANVHAYPNHAAGEGYSIGPNGAAASDSNTGAYGSANRWISDHIPYTNWTGYVQDSMDYAPQTFWQWVDWGHYLGENILLTTVGGALTSSGGSALLVHELTDHP